MKECRKVKGGKRQVENKPNKIVTVIRYFIIFIITMICSYMAYGIYREGKIRTIVAENKQENETNDIIQVDEKENKKSVIKPSVPVVETYLGYTVDSRLEIPKIKLNTNVLEKYSTKGLEVCASKYYGPSANEVGNYCIAGHNYDKENMFNHLIDLTIGDSIFLTDNENGIVEYEVYDIYKVKPKNVEPLSQETEERRELTLITCVNYSKNRLVIKASEK